MPLPAVLIRESNKVMLMQNDQYLIVAVGLLGILKGKQKLGVTFNSNKLGGIDFYKIFKTAHVQCLGGSPGHCTSQHRPAPALHMLSFEHFVKSMPPSLSELKVTPSFCFTFKIPDNVTASIIYLHKLS